jgi:hypothetical protein
MTYLLPCLGRRRSLCLKDARSRRSKEYDLPKWVRLEYNA